MPAASSSASIVSDLAAAALVLFLTAVPAAREVGWVVRGVEIGMRDHLVASHFSDAAHGRFVEIPGCELPTLEWTRTRPGTPTRWARFSFRWGRLAAVRIRSDGQAAAATIAATGEAVRVIANGDDGTTTTTLLARWCPLHAAEVASWLARRNVDPASMAKGWTW